MKPMSLEPMTYCHFCESYPECYPQEDEKESDEFYEHDPKDRPPNIWGWWRENEMEKEEFDTIKDFIKIATKEALLEFFREGIPKTIIKTAILEVDIERKTGKTIGED